MKNIMEQMVELYQQNHNRLPKAVTVAPTAMVALATKHQLLARVSGVQVTCRLFEQTEVTPGGENLGIFVQQVDGGMQLRCCDLK